jgi:pimeloyl-ACP methyl ester carboxylesterase
MNPLAQAAGLRAAYAVPPRRTDVEVGGRSVHLRSWGDPGAPTVLMVHGSHAHGGWWDHLAPALAETRHVIACDLFGHGDSDWLPEYSWDGLAAQVAGLARRYQAVSVVGHSLGGAVSLAAAVGEDPGFERLVMLDTPLPETRVPLGSSPPEPVLRLEPYASLDAARRRFRLVPPSPLEPDPLVMEHIFRQGLRRLDTGWEWKRDPAVVARAGAQPGLSELAVVADRAVLVRAGRGLIRSDVADLVYEAGGRGMRITELPNAGHHLLLDSPSAVLAILQHLL